MTRMERSSVNHAKINGHTAGQEEQALRMVVNNSRPKEKEREDGGYRLIYDRPIFRAKKHDPF